MRKLSISPEQVTRGNLILVNAAHAYCAVEPERKFSEIRPDYPEIRLHKQAKASLQQLLHAMHAETQIVPVSGLRDAAEQAEIFETCLAENGVGYTTNFVAMPGHSEHHTGLAIDLAENSAEIDFVCPAFPESGICQRFREQCADYGFIERYGAGKEYITGIAHEPWHFRYVGYPHARLIQDAGLTLEEYIDNLRQYRQGGTELRYFDPAKTNGSYTIFYVPVAKEEVSIQLPEQVCCRFSGNNIDGVIVTTLEMRQ